jgi:hypothetical protein
VVGQVPPPGTLESVKPELGCLVEFGVDQGTIVLVDVARAQVGGLVRTVLEPSKLSFTEVNGVCGFSLISVVNWPVTGLALVWPTRRTEMPWAGASASTKMRNSSPELGSRLSCCPR